MAAIRQSSPMLAVTESTVEERSLPSLPHESIQNHASTVAQSRPTPPRPSQSFNQPKRKVLCKGKACIIAMPMTDREQAGLPPLLTAQERRDIIQKWADEGYPVRGFSVGEWASITNGSGGASRTIFPDADDLAQERKSTRVSVYIPDHAEWQAWVDYLKEEKLRALGVTPSASEAAPSTMSPFSSTTSQVSSAYPSMVASPPVPPMSAASIQPRMTHSPFPPALTGVAPAGFAPLSRRGTPLLPHGQRPVHGYTQSTAIPGLNQRMTPQFDYSISQPAAFGSGMRSPNEQFSGRRSFSPRHVQNMQSMGHILPSISLAPSPQGFTRNLHSNPQLAHIQRQQEITARQQQQIYAQLTRAQHQRQMSILPLGAMSTEQLPLTPKAVSPEREPPEIMHPTPRSHRHNLSAALEKGITHSDIASIEGLAANIAGDKPAMENHENDRDSTKVGGVREEEEEQAELPILSRPKRFQDSAEEREEIETNPSNAGTPLLLDDRNPFAYFKPLSQQGSPGQHSALTHYAQPSSSAFNVQAKEFNPSSFIPGNTFNSGVNGFAPNAMPTANFAGPLSHIKSHQRNMSSLNVEAPVFTPSFLTTRLPEEPKQDTMTKRTAEVATPAKAALELRGSAFNFTSAPSHTDETTPAKSDFDPRSSTFSFTSANYSVEAPEFKPSGSLHGTVSTPERTTDLRGSIFGDVVIEPSSKPQRRNKAVPITKAKSREGTPEDKEENFDADGRAEAPSDRQKRARFVGTDGDDMPLFAEGAPFTSLADDEKAVIVDQSTNDGEEPFESATEAAKEATEPVVEEVVVKSNKDGENGIANVPIKSQAAPENMVNEPHVEQASVQPPPETEAEAAQSADSEKHDLQGQEPIKCGTPIQVTQQEEQSARLEPPLLGSIEPQRKDEDEPVEPETIPEANTAPLNVATRTPLTHNVEEQAFDTRQTVSTETPETRPAATSTSKPESSLSALAKPFEFKPAALDFVVTSKTEKPSPPNGAKESTSNEGGLMASKFATSLSPESVVPETTEQPLAQPRALFGEHTHDQAHETQVKSKPAGETTIVEDVAKNVNAETDSQADGLDQISNLANLKKVPSRPESVVSRADGMSYEEINAVMQQFEENPDLGVIREDDSVEETPLIDMRLPQQNFRSNLSSPSPEKLDNQFPLPNASSRTRPYKGLGFEVEGVHQLNYGNAGISDWNAELSPGQQDKLEARAHFFDDHVNDLVDNVLESRLAPVERALANIQHAVQSVARKPRGGRRSLSTENRESDADDEDEYDAYEGYSHYRSMSPKKRDRRQETIKVAVMEAMAAAQVTPTLDISRMMEEMKTVQQHRAPESHTNMLAVQTTLDELRQLVNEKMKAAGTDLSSIHQNLAELKQQQDRPRAVQDDFGNFKSIIEDVISSHPKLRDLPVAPDHDHTNKLLLKLEGLEATLKIAETRANEEAALKRGVEVENDTLRTQLKNAQDQATTYKEASEKAQRNLEAMLSEEQEHRDMTTKYHDLHARNESIEQKAEALEKTLDEYRKYKEQMRQEIDAERKRSESLVKHLQDVRDQARDQMESRDVLRDQLNQLQQRMAKAMEDIRHDEGEWRKREHEITSQNHLLQSALDHEAQKRTRLELEVEELHKEHKESLHFRSLHENAQVEVARLADVIVGLQSQNKSHQDTAYEAQRELKFLQEKQKATIESQTERLLDELEASKNTIRNLRSDSDDRIVALQSQVDTTAIEMQEQKVKHEQNMQRMFENHNHAMRQVNHKHSDELEQALNQADVKHRADLEHRLGVHAEKLIELQKRHARDLQHADEDRSRLEHKYTEQLHLARDKIEYLESKLFDLESQLEITKTAARTAIEAATAKIANLPTPAPSVVASPPHRVSIGGASMSVARGSDLPEKISPQALRETIMVLQDQLQNREQKIDKLEAQLAAVDKDAPNKIKERETEIVMLRELLDVRVEDLQELISTLEKPRYDHAAVKDAAIRIKTQLKMEQHLKERAISDINLPSNLPASISAGLANLAQSPRAMVAAAAWGNWRKVRDTSFSAVSDFANSVGPQTPSRSNTAPASLLAGVATPQDTSLRSPSNGSRPSTSRPLATAAATRRTESGSLSGGARPLRAFSSQPRTLSSARLLTRDTNESPADSLDSVIRPSNSSSTKVEPPSTPLALKPESDFGDDVDEDASPLDGKNQRFDSGDIEELIEPERTVMESLSPQSSKTMAQSDEEDETVVVVEEE